MPVYQSAKLIDDLQQKTELFLQQAVSEWQTMPQPKLLQQPGENQWSVAQCLEHLNSYARYYLPEIEKAVETATQKSWSAGEQFTAGLIGNYFTNLMMPESKGKRMKKMSAPKNHTPAASLDSCKVVSEFIDHQEKMLDLLEKARKIDLNKAKVPVSIAKFIKLKLGDVFMFLNAHTLRHIIQAERAAATRTLKAMSSS
ncbi:MAG: hypothetical protein AVDCRST_MAG96-2901 [uncultured Segetibacter sp.]|uniref:DinB-like domain-containing protein n=1 Tax=uncultured Segetibacter sp. TaxID=481133 RepID=A0A6J4TEH8_9BACT|nr:MAG: hypothetical protein AVDCRST_MAG96-2901 [uncultured Segetibacter sp.]